MGDFWAIFGRFFQRLNGDVGIKTYQKASVPTAGLPDFSWYNIPKRKKSIPNDLKMYQKAIKITIRP
jgi:hypothetical protein